MLRIVIGFICFGDLSQSEKLSEIEPPLVWSLQNSEEVFNHVRNFRTNFHLFRHFLCFNALFVLNISSNDGFTELCAC